MHESHAALMRELEPSLSGLLGILKPVDGCWQPSDVLPQAGTEGWHEQVEALREEAGRLSDEMVVVLVGNVITEEALPSYQTSINRFAGVQDHTGTDPHMWAVWSRAWTSEENRHGDVTRIYLYLSGRADMRSMEVTLQHLIRNGFDTLAGGDPYRGLVYTSVQEHATKVSWQQLGKLARGVGAPLLHKICGLVAADEARHERIYTALLKEVLQRDPEGALDALRDMLGRGVIMPARTMTDGHDTRLFAHFADVGQRLGVYTAEDYLGNLEQLIDYLGLPGLRDLSGEGERLRDEVCALPDRFRAMGAGRMPRTARPVPFRWIHGRRA